MTTGPSEPRPLSVSEERNWALAAHVGSLVSAWFALGLLCPLVIWLIFRDRSEYVRRHAVESLNFQISLLIYSAVAVIIGMVTLGLGLLVIIPLAVVAGIAVLVLIILATVAAAEGRDYRYPVTIRMVR